MDTSSPQPPPDYVADPFLPDAYRPGQAGFLWAFENFIARRHVAAVIVDPAYPQQWTQALAALGLKPVAVGGVLFYRV